MTVALPSDVKPLKLSVAGNFGNTLPMGSREIKNLTLHILSKDVFIYLNFGAG